MCLFTKSVCKALCFVFLFFCVTIYCFKNVYKVCVKIPLFCVSISGPLEMQNKLKTSIQHDINCFQTSIKMIRNNSMKTENEPDRTREDVNWTTDHTEELMRKPTNRKRGKEVPLVSRYTARKRKPRF